MGDPMVHWIFNVSAFGFAKRELCNLPLWLSVRRKKAGEEKWEEEEKKTNKQYNHYMLFYRTPHTNQHTNTLHLCILFPNKFWTKTLYPITDIRLCLNMNIGNINTGTSCIRCRYECVWHCVCAHDWGEFKSIRAVLCALNLDDHARCRLAFILIPNTEYRIHTYLNVVRLSTLYNWITACTLTWKWSCV